MKAAAQQFIVVLIGSLISISAMAAQQVPQLVRAQLPGRQVKVSAICIGFGGEHDAKLKLAIEHLHVAGKNGVDIACLPEEFAGTNAEPVPGPTTNAIAEVAKQYNTTIRSKAKTAVLATEATEVTEERREEGLTRRRSENPVFWSLHLRSSLCFSVTSVASFLSFLPGR